MKQYHEITLLHVIACAMILLCHFFQDAKIGSLGEFFLSGLSLFFVISGFLTGLKPITDGKWVRNRFKRILIPYYVVLSVFLLTLFFFTDEFRGVDALHLITATQGINYIYWPYDGYHTFSGLGHLWYVTLILLFFALTPFLNKVYDKLHFNINQWYITFAVLIVILQPLLIYIGIQSSYIISFLIGYLYAKVQYRVTIKKWLVFAGITIGVAAVRIICRNLIDGSLFYDRYLALLSQGCIGFLIFVTIFLIGSFAQDHLKKLATGRIIVLLASVIYEIYLLHYFFLKGPWAIKNYVGSLVVADIIVAVLSVTVGLILSGTNKKIAGWLDTDKSETSKIANR